MSTNTAVLITGANRGLGRGLLEIYLARPSHTVIAAVRDPAATATTLDTLPRAESTILLVVKIDSADPASSAAALAELQSAHNIQRLDVLIANAGIAKTYPLAREAMLSDLREHFEVNTFGPLALFQAFVPLLEQTPGSKFAAISSGAASIGAMEKIPLPNSVYGTSKAALNYLVRKMALESDSVIVFSVDPGWVQTDMGNFTARGWGMEKAQLTIDESVNGIAKVIDSATKETSGLLKSYDGGETPW
ncbi:hypothetical protein NUU61_006711 [Penicillium alfredii]|uniref:Uncharacterized protein n=1 Tax=Penicillium alfredii TaxID=1506179 RepID=A0A9W9F1P0_9EURO|nr:uncharacterized protein NUU61_006711 [Penicillium alfredii]KAJ5091841.1 hypothetical protein NUU61_006711 [Penicillium alfredii]